MEERHGVEVTGVCKICKDEGKTEMHHIISQSMCNKKGRPDLLTNPHNLIELCRQCHSWTDSSIYQKWYQTTRHYGQRTREEVRLGREKKRIERGLFQCNANIKSGRRCELGIKEENGYCKIHKWWGVNQARKANKDN